MEGKIVNRKDKIKVRILEALRGKAELNYRPGRVLRITYPRPNSKDRRHSGRKTVFYDIEDYPYMETFWDDWVDYRDGFRDKTRLFKHPCCFYWDEHLEDFISLKKKIKKQIKIRKARKAFIKRLKFFS